MAQGAAYPGDIHFTRENSDAERSLLSYSSHGAIFLLLSFSFDFFFQCILLIFFLFGHWIKGDIQ